MSAIPLSRAGRSPRSADPPDEIPVVDLASRTVVVDLVVAALVAVPPTVCLLAIGGISGDSGWPDWVALASPVIAATAVLVCRRHVVIGAVLLTLALLGVPAATKIFEATSPLVQFFSLSPLIAVAIVYCAVGARLALAQSLTLMGCSAAVQVTAGGDDVVFLLVGLGWWFIGRLLRSRMAVADSLRIRAVELAAERDRFAAEAVALERTKIARELHDVVAHCMTVVVIQSRAGRQLLGTDPEAAREAVDVIVAVTAEAEADIGALVELMDPVRGRPLTRAGLDELVGRAAMTGTSITVAITGEPDDLAPELAKVARRVVQEALTNCLRHAPGAAITIDISCGPTVVVAVANGPTGSTPSTGAARADLDDGSMTQQASLGWAGAGKGLLGLRERVAEAGGEVNWGSIESGGWLVRAVFPS